MGLGETLPPLNRSIGTDIEQKKQQPGEGRRALRPGSMSIVRRPFAQGAFGKASLQRKVCKTLNCAGSPIAEDDVKAGVC